MHCVWIASGSGNIENRHEATNTFLCIVSLLIHLCSLFFYRLIPFVRCRCILSFVFDNDVFHLNISIYLSIGCIWGGFCSQWLCVCVLHAPNRQMGCWMESEITLEYKCHFKMHMHFNQNDNLWRLCRFNTLETIPATFIPRPLFIIRCFILLDFFHNFASAFGCRIS